MKKKKKHTAGNILRELLLKKKQNVLNIYCTAGYPRIDSLPDVVQALQENGADIIEVGIPYSDPIADGPVIQYSNTVALQNGISLPVILDQLAGLKHSIHVPVILMGYLNPIMQYGFQQFCSDAASAGVSGLIIPDLPYHEYKKDYASLMGSFGLELIFLITPHTASKRVTVFVSEDPPFLYAVSAPGTTGVNAAFKVQESYRESLKKINEKIPVLVGFGIGNRQDFEQVSEFASGAIIGSAYIKALGSDQSLAVSTRDFMNSILNPS